MLDTVHIGKQVNCHDQTTCRIFLSNLSTLSSFGLIITHNIFLTIWHYCCDELAASLWFTHSTVDGCCCWDVVGVGSVNYKQYIIPNNAILQNHWKDENPTTNLASFVSHSLWPRKIVRVCVVPLEQMVTHVIIIISLPPHLPRGDQKKFTHTNIVVKFLTFRF